MLNNGRKITTIARIRNELIGAFFIACLIVVLFYFESVMVSGSSHYDNFFIFSIINFNIILIVLLIFLIIRNIIKFLYEKSVNILGTKLRTKLVLAFAVAALVPTLFLFIFSTIVLSGSVNNWFEHILSQPLQETESLVEAYQQQSCRYSQNEANLLSSSITANALFEEDYRETLRGMFNRRISSQQLAYISLYLNKTEVLLTFDASLQENGYKPLTEKEWDIILAGNNIEEIIKTPEGVFARAVVPLVPFPAANTIIGAVVVDSLINPEISVKMENLVLAKSKQKEMLSLKNPIKITYVVVLLSATLLLIFIAMWFGLLFVRKITDPIDELAEATLSVASGNFNHYIEKTTDDEIGTLVDSFNKMTATIKKSREELRTATISMEERRKYIETVLEHASTGVVVVDKRDVITTFNSAAQKILSVSADAVLGRNYRKIIPEEYQNLLQEILQELEETPQNILAKHHIQIIIASKTLQLLVTAAKFFDDTGNTNGIVLIFDDMTQVQQAERAAVWRDAAKKMAHEIKNPLTPIQLSAQRLKRRFQEKIPDTEDFKLFDECTNIIIEQVDLLKRLTNSFSEYAKMPRTELEPCDDVNSVIAKPLNLFREAHKNIEFIFEGDSSLPIISIDAEKINRVMVNLLDNAVASLEGKKDGKIVLSSRHNRKNNSVRIEIRDNGCGIPQQNKRRIFEPYFSTKATGTGLGLAIVNSIINDHGGTIGTTDNEGGGTIVFFDIPLPTTA